MLRRCENNFVKDRYERYRYLTKLTDPYESGHGELLALLACTWFIFYTTHHPCEPSTILFHVKS